MLINRANEILLQLEQKNADEKGDIEVADLKEKVKDLSRPKMQLSIFDAHSVTFEEIRAMLETVDVNRLTPVEALLKLQEIKGKIK